eukprot:SAG11_NODE_34939_length_269_cov_0.611765_2_plen_55_part_01
MNWMQVANNYGVAFTPRSEWYLIAKPAKVFENEFGRSIIMSQDGVKNLVVKDEVP